MANRTLICTVAALSSGIFGFWAGGQLNLTMAKQQCKERSWGVSAVCKMTVTPAAWWQGSITGVWMGAILGAFVAGSLTREVVEPPSPQSPRLPSDNPTLDLSTLKANEVTITPPHDEAMRCLLVLLAIQNGTTETAQMLQPHSLTDAQQLLAPLGFSDPAIDQAWHFFETIGQKQQ